MGFTKQYKTGALEDLRTSEDKEKDFLYKEIATAPYVEWREKPMCEWRSFPKQDQNGIKIDDAKLHNEGVDGYICHNNEKAIDEDNNDNKLDYKYDFLICDDWKEGDYGVSNLQPKHRTIDDLEYGDYVVNNAGNKQRCIGRCGEIVYLSDIERYHRFGSFDAIEYYKNIGYTLYQPTEEKETDIDKCIKVVEGWSKDLDTNCHISDELVQLLQALKNLKK